MTNPTTYRIATLAAACAALMSTGAAHAVDWTGYMRGGPAATTVSSESRQCYGLNSPGLKYRLGNECDFYGEFQLAQAVKADGVDFNAVLMTNFYSPQTETNHDYGIEQAYVEMKGVDIAPQALFWMGKRRDRDDVHIVDTFFTNMSGRGRGRGEHRRGLRQVRLLRLQDRLQPRQPRRQHQRHRPPARPALRHRRSTRTASCAWWAPSPRPTRKAVSRARTASASRSSTCRTSSSVAATTSGPSTPRVQPTSTRASATRWPSSDTKSYRIVESPSWQIGAFGGQAIALYQHDKDDTTQLELVHARRARLLRPDQEPEVPDRSRLFQPQAQRRPVGEPDQDHRGPDAVDRPGLLEASGTAPVRDLRGLQQGRRARRAERPAAEQDQRGLVRRASGNLVLRRPTGSSSTRARRRRRPPAPRT